MRPTGISIESPRPNQVFQRSDEYAADIPVSGRLSGAGTVEYRLSDGRWHRAEREGDRFSGVVQEVPVGGPYTLEVRVTAKGKASLRRITGLLVGDLWILAGQSNMDGCGKLVNLEPPSRMVHAFYYDETWDVARDPLCWVNESIDPVHWFSDDAEERERLNRENRAFRENGAGLGVRFGRDLYRATGVPVGLLVCSHGGTSMAQWDPSLKSQGGKSLYGSMLRRVREAGGRAAGCLWYQGESDAHSADKGTGYAEKLRVLVESIRSDFGTPDMPFIQVQLGPFFDNEATASEGWNRVQTEQLAAEKQIAHSALVTAIDSTLTDPIHLDAVSLRRIGARMALQAQRLRFGRTDIEAGPRPSGISYADDSRTRLRITFAEVNGTLKPARGRCGYTVEANGHKLEVRGWARDAGDHCSVVITLAEPAPKGSVLWYGKGLTPGCELVDALDLAVPVFGPAKL